MEIGKGIEDGIVSNLTDAVMGTKTLAQAAESLANDQLSVTVWDEAKLREENMNGIIAVGQGSSNPPYFIHLHYKPKGEARKKIALAGKGVTFDAGGGDELEEEEYEYTV